MKPRLTSLRQRLFLLILTPLLLMGLLLGFWRISVAQRTSEELFDRTLLSAALAVSRDIVISEGDAILPSTRDLIGDAAGGEVFYHATGPGGVYVTGYAYPPTGAATSRTPYEPVYFEASYRGEDVRVLQITERVTMENLTGDATVTVWQRTADRTRFVRELAVRALVLIGALLVTLALVVWFGVARGLRPLLDLEDAISKRTPDDLSTIKRPVPEEARGILSTLNRLFQQLESSLSAHQAFISDAAHQLRNPAAAVQSMAEAVRDAGSEAERCKRAAELVDAARSSARITNQLLSLDRLRHGRELAQAERFNLSTLAEEVCAVSGAAVLSAGAEFEFEAGSAELPVLADRLLIAEALTNLIDNALKHGGAGLTFVHVTTGLSGGMAELTVEDNGAGLSPEDEEKAFSRFGQLRPASGSGLGLAIAASVAANHGGSLRINRAEKGASLTLALPLARG